MDSAEQIFENFLKGGYQYLCQVRDEQRIETELIDYKTIKRDSSPMSSDDISNLSKALSGFANSGGGVIVWGVDCRRTKGSEEPDCVKKLQPISGLKRLLSDLNSRSPEIVDGAVIGIRHEVLEEPKGSDSGFAFSYIPKGEGLPHQAQDKAFYYRSGSTFQKMPTWMVADRMRRNSSPVLELVWLPMEPNIPVPRNDVPILLLLVNASNVVARHVSVILDYRNTYYCERFQPIESSTFDLWHYHEAGLIKMGVKPGVSIFPRFHADITSFNFDVTDELAVQDIKYTLQCDGYFHKGEMTIFPDEIAEIQSFTDDLTLQDLPRPPI